MATPLPDADGFPAFNEFGGDPPVRIPRLAPSMPDAPPDPWHGCSPAALGEPVPGSAIKGRVQRSLRRHELILTPDCLAYGPLQGLLLGFIAYWSTYARAGYFRTVSEEVIDKRGRKRKCRASEDLVYRDIMNHEGRDYRDELKPGFIQKGNPVDAGWSGTCSDIIDRLKLENDRRTVNEALSALAERGLIRRVTLQANGKKPYQHLHLALNRESLFPPMPRGPFIDRAAEEEWGENQLGHRIIVQSRHAPAMLRYSPALSFLPIRQGLFLAWLVYRCAGDEKRSRMLPRDPDGRPMWYFSKRQIGRLLHCSDRAAFAVVSELAAAGLIAIRRQRIDGVNYYSPIYETIAERLEPGDLADLDPGNDIMMTMTDESFFGKRPESERNHE